MRAFSCCCRSLLSLSVAVRGRSSVRRDLSHGYRWAANTTKSNHSPKTQHDTSFSNQKPILSQAQDSNPNPTPSHYVLNYQDVQQYMESLRQSTYRGYSVLHLAGFGLSCLGLLIIFKDDIAKYVGRETAEVAKFSLQDKELLERSEALAKTIVQTLLTDPSVTSKASSFVNSVFQMPETKKALADAGQALLADPETMVFLRNYSLEMISYLSLHPETSAKVGILLGTALKGLLADQGMRDAAVVFLGDVLRSAHIQEHAFSLASNASQQLLLDERLLQQSKAFLQEVLQDREVRHDAANAVWGGRTPDI